MDIDAQASSQLCTILRIKRKRNEEPLDALVVDSSNRRKKAKGGIGVFQFAKTVESDAWNDEQRQRDIQEAITKLARERGRESPVKLEQTSVEDVDATPRIPPSPTLQRLGKMSAQRTLSREPTRRYTVVMANPPSPSQSIKRPTSPIISSKDPTKAPDFRMYDAVLSTDQSGGVEPEMGNFLPMVMDYLKLHDINLSDDLSATATASPSTTATDPDSDGEDYVWDVFYHRPATLGEWNAAANIGTLTGLPPSIFDEYDSDSEEEEKDEADEDSNAEEYYKNDYPDEESSTDSEHSDVFHEHSDYDDLLQYE